MEENILVVDDDIVTLRILESVLTKAGYSARVAKSGEEALERIKEKKPDLVILDIKMPGMDGIGTLKEIRKIDAKLTVVMLTAYGTMKSAVEVFKLGAYDYIDKPVNEKDLLDKVKRALGQ